MTTISHQIISNELTVIGRLVDASNATLQAHLKVVNLR